MAGPGKIKDVLTPPATKDPPWKRTGRDVLWPCGYFGQNPTPATHSYCQFWEKRVRLQQWIQISSCPSVQHFKDYHPILRRIIIHGISCWWKKAFQVMCLFSEIDRVLCFMRKRTRGQGIRGRVRRESHQRRYNLVILRMFEIQAPDYWTFILLAGLVTRPCPLPLPFPIQPFLYFRLEAILEISHTHGSQSSVLLLNFTSQLTPLLSVGSHFIFGPNSE